MGRRVAPRRGEGAKSTAKLVGPLGCERFFVGWDTPCVRVTCKVLAVSVANEYLGTVIGGDCVGDGAQEQGSSLQSAMHKVGAKRDAIKALQCPAAELTLLRRCADVSSLTYWLRCHGDRVLDATLAAHDIGIRTALENTLGGPIPETFWCQASLGVPTVAA